MATSGDHYLATSGDFFMATDSPAWYFSKRARLRSSTSRCVIAFTLKRCSHTPG